MGFLTIKCGRKDFTFEDVAFLGFEHSISEPVISFGRSDRSPSTIIRLGAWSSAQAHQQLIIMVYGAPSLVNEHSAVCSHGFPVFVAGSYAARISPSLKTVFWKQKCDVGSCFGIYRVETENTLIVHGELAITKLSSEGKILWQAEGRDTFIQPPAIHGDDITVTDASGVVYSIKMDSGIIQALDEGTGC